MKKISTLLVFGVIFSVAVFGQHETKTEPLPSFSMGMEAVFPTGDLSSLSSMGVGLRMQTVRPFCSMAGVSFSAGVTNYFTTKEVKTVNVKNILAFPAEAGCRLFTAKGLYIEPKGGFTFFAGKSNSDIAFTYAVNAGVKAGSSFDISIGYENALLSGLNLSHVGINVAYIFH
jgi:hypothetical protein